MGEGEGLGGYAGAIAENAATGWKGEHGIAEADDEVWVCSRFAQVAIRSVYVYHPPGQMGVLEFSFIIWQPGYWVGVVYSEKIFLKSPRTCLSRIEEGY